jgi:hypothetical protein
MKDYVRQDKTYAILLGKNPKETINNDDGSEFCECVENYYAKQFSHIGCTSVRVCSRCNRRI